MLERLSDITVAAFVRLWEGFLNLVPNLIVAIVVFVIGWFISVAIGKVVAEILKRLKFNQLFERGNWDEALAKADIKVDASGFIGAIVKWILVIVFLLMAVDILGLDQFAALLNRILAYLPNVFVAALVFVVTVIVVDIVEKLVRAAVEGVKIGYGHIVSVIIKWGIWIFAIVIILEQLNIGGEIPGIVMTGIVGFLALAAGLAFGLGGKEVAAEILGDLKHKLKEK